MISSQNSLAVPKGTAHLDTVVVIPEYMQAPVKRGQQVGTAAFYNGSSLVCEIPLIVKSDVKRLSFGYVLKNMLLEND